jgi:hypothetical protein
MAGLCVLCGARGCELRLRRSASALLEISHPRTPVRSFAVALVHVGRYVSNCNRAAYYPRPEANPGFMAWRRGAAISRYNKKRTI